MSELSKQVHDDHDERQVIKRRSRRFIIALLLILLVLCLPLIYVSPIGQAWRQARDMAALDNDTFRVDEFSEPTDADEFWLKFLPREGVLQPIVAYGSHDDGKLPGMLQLADKFTGWERVDFTVSRGSEAALRARLEQWKGLTTLGLDGDFDHSVLPMLAEHRELDFLSINSPNCDSKVLQNVRSAETLVWLWLRPAISDDGLKQIITMPALKNLDLSDNAAITGGPFVQTSSSTIEYLNVSRTGFDDAGLAAVLKWPALRELYALDSNVTDHGLADADLSESLLTVLDLSDTELTSGALPQIAQLSELKMLELEGTAVADDNLEALNTLDSLFWLYLFDTQVTGAGLRKLRLPSLQIISIDGPNVTAADLEELVKHHPQLDWVDVQYSKLTDAETAALRARYPQVTFKITEDEF